MPFYNLSEQEYQNHIGKHLLNRPVNIRERYCHYYYPPNSIPTDNIPNGFPTFWLWISLQYSAEQYSAYSISAFRLLEENIYTATDLHFIANITSRLLQSICFQTLAVPFLELCYYTHKLFVSTNSFSTLPTGPQVTNAYNLFHNINNNQVLNMAAATHDELKAIFQNIFGIDPTQQNNPNALAAVLGNVQTAVTATNTALTTTNTAITNLATANANRTTGKIVDVPLFHGRDDEDPYDWCKIFEQAFDANGWPAGNNDTTKIALAAGHLRDAARDWYEAKHGDITRWHNNDNAHDFDTLMINYLSTEAKRNQWTRDLQNVKQRDGESVEDYSRRFNKLLRKAQGAQALANRYQVTYFINGLTPLLVSQVVLGSPADLAAAITRAKLVETGVKVALQNNLLVQTTPVATTTTAKTSSPAEVSIEALTKQMEQLSINYANLSNAMTNNNNNNNNRNRGRNYGTRPQVSFGNNNNRPSTIQCFNCGKIGHIARNCSAPRNRGNFQSQPRRNAPNVKPMNYMEYEEEDYYDDEYQEEEYYDDYEAETYVSTRERSYEAPVSPSKRRKQSESRKEESLRMSPQDVEAPMDFEFTPFGTTAPHATKEKKPRRKMIPAPIEQLNEFNVATYLQDLPCGLSVGQAAHEIPKYRSGLIRAVRRTREKETHYAEQQDGNDQTTAAKCEIYVGRTPITAVIDSGAATSIITKTLLQQLGYTINEPSNMVIVTANGTRVRALGMVKDIPINIKHMLIKTPVHVLESKDKVLILGNDWLRRVNATVSWEEEKLSLKHKGRFISVPLTFTLAKNLITTEALEESEEEETENEYEDEELIESSIYYSDNALSSEDDIEFNPWEDHVPSPPILIESEEEEEEFINPAIYLASVEKGTQKESNPDLHLGPITHNQQNAFHQLLENYKDICAKSQTDIGQTNVIRHKIITRNAPPIAQPPYRCNPINKEFLQNEILKLEEQGLVRKSVSPWASPIVIVEKKGGEKRLCIDYRKVNAVTKADAYPLPRIDDILESFSSANWFTTLDLASGYWQVAMEEDDVEKTAFITPFGLYEWMVMPFGLSYAPGTFQRLMNRILQEYLGKFVVVYLDDVIIYSKGSLEDHLDHIRQVFETLRRVNLKIKLKKCYFCLPNIHFLGHIVGRNGIRPDPDKIEKVKNFPVPNNLTELRAALGLFSYYRKFIKDFSRIAKPITSLLKKDIPFKWTQKHQTAFNNLKERLTLAPILSYPDFELPFILYTDASGTGLGAVLSQKQKDGKEHVISYASRSLNVYEQNYSVTDQECLAIVWALKKFSHYLELQHFTVVTDHAAWKWMKTSKLPKGRRARWMMDIQQYKFDIQHRPEKANANADALSRMYEEEVQYTSCFMMDYEYPPVNPQKRQKIDKETAIYITLSELITDVELPYEGDTEEEQEAPVASSSKPLDYNEPEEKGNDNWNSANTLVNDTWNWNDTSVEKLDKGKTKETSPRLSPRPWGCCCGKTICTCRDSDFEDYIDPLCTCKDNEYDPNDGYNTDHWNRLQQERFDAGNDADIPWDERVDRYEEYPRGWETWSEDSRELYHFCKALTETGDARYAYDKSKLNEYGVPHNYIYQPTKEEVEDLFKQNIKIKQVIAGQPILRGGSRCDDFMCDIENHHIHTYCKMCKRNLPYGTTIHRCLFGFDLGQIHPDMDPKFLVNNLWWKEPQKVIEENNIIYLDAFIRLYFNQIPEVD